MFEPIRGGTRGGQAEFKWSDVSADKDREHYLGHSINAPTGRWQKNKDVHWYNRGVGDGSEERQAEIRQIKEAEEEAMAQALGFAPTKKSATIIAPIGENTKESLSASMSPAGQKEDVHEEGNLYRKMEKKLRKAEKKTRKEEERARKKPRRPEERSHEKQNLSCEYEDETHLRIRHSRSQLHSPPRRQGSRERQERRYSFGRRSASPPPRNSRMRSRSPPARNDPFERGHYGADEMERERERDRRRWDVSNRRRDGFIARQPRG